MCGDGVAVRMLVSFEFSRLQQHQCSGQKMCIHSACRAKLCDCELQAVALAVLISKSVLSSAEWLGRGSQQVAQADEGEEEQDEEGPWCQEGWR